MPISATTNGPRRRPGLKTIGDATEIRARILTAFEKAEVSEDPALRRKLLTFVIVGGGPTGVELAGAIVELARKAIVRDFRHIDSSTARVILVEAGPRLLTAFPESLSQSAKAQLERLGVEVRLGHAVTQCDGHGVMLADGEPIGSGCVLWAAGVMASRAATWLGAEADRAGRVIVNDDLSVPGHPEIFVLGDTALVKGEDGQPVPGVAPAAKQMGRYAARLIKARLAGQPTAKPFRYIDYGNLATDRPQGGRRRFRPHPAERLARLAAVELRASVVPGRLPQPHRRLPRLGLGLRDLRPRRAPDHRAPRRLEAEHPPIRTACDRRESRSAPRPCRRAAWR